MNWGEIIKTLETNLIPVLKISVFSVFGSSIFVFLASDYLNENFGDWPYNLEQLSIISFLLSSFALIFFYFPTITKITREHIEKKRIENLVKNLDALEEKIIFSMSLNPEKPLKIADFCKYEAPQEKTTAEIYSAIVALKNKRLVKSQKNGDELISLTDQGIQRSIEIQKKTFE